MKFGLISKVAVISALLLSALGLGSLAADDGKTLMDFTNVCLETLKIKAVPAEKDPKTGFIVGGKNATSLIPGLKEINGRSIAELEREMRPGAASTAGFLGNDEKLLEVLAEDNKYVTEELGRTHQELALHLRVMVAIASNAHVEEFLYHGRRFKVTLAYTLGYQESPFHDDTRTDALATIENLTNGKKLRFSPLVPDMIERYGLYEGKGTFFRVDPEKVVDVLDFLKKQP